jgi:hypothetical protein
VVSILLRDGMVGIPIIWQPLHAAAVQVRLEPTSVVADVDGRSFRCLTCRTSVAVVNEDWRAPRQHIVRVRAGRSSPAFSLVIEFRPVRGRAWKCRVVRPCCRQRCRQTATRVRAVEWALAGVLPALGSGMVRGPYAGPATRAGLDLPGI